MRWRTPELGRRLRAGAAISAVAVAAVAPSAIRSTLVDPTPPMPSFRSLAREKLRALVYFLSEL
ncbi:MAG: hypothetical protein QOJ25_3405 [Solirubrobacteraceae bacterium]|nr:hypothetical protein [Solirubrobacteraceae bacterium]